MIERGISQRDLDRLWCDAGGRITVIRRTGERRYVHDTMRARSRAYNARRKDASAKLVSFVRQTLGEIQGHVE